MNAAVATPAASSFAESPDVAIDSESPDSQSFSYAAISSPRAVRFPAGHRPQHTYDDYINSSLSPSAIPSLTSASTFESKLDISPTDAAARKGVLQDSLFPQWKDDSVSIEPTSPEEMQKADPLMSQVWRLYQKNKSQLPNGERMENLTWRMMSMNLKRLERERGKGYVFDCILIKTFQRECVLTLTSLGRPALLPASRTASTGPSGIAQLRQSIDASAESRKQETMNLDDFIVPTSVASPAGIAPSPAADQSDNALASAIPIRRDVRAQDDSHLARASAPSVPPAINHTDEFGYVQRHVRKTSIDERRVSLLSTLVPLQHEF